MTTTSVAVVMITVHQISGEEAMTTLLCLSVMMTVLIKVISYNNYVILLDRILYFAPYVILLDIYLIYMI